MVTTIGFRATPTDVRFAVFDGDQRSVVNIEILRIPTAFSGPEGLKFIRSNVLDILREYDVAYAGIRTTEPSAQSIDLRRVQVEGVIQEAFASSTLKGFYAGPIAIIAHRLGIDRARFKPMVAGENDLGVDGWADMPTDPRCPVTSAHGRSDDLTAGPRKRHD